MRERDAVLAPDAPDRDISPAGERGSPLWGLDIIEAPEAWTITRGRPDVVVAVVEQGFYVEHPEIRHALLPGIDLLGSGTLAGQPEASDHGTHICGIIAGRQCGVAPGVRLLPIRCHTYDDEQVATAIRLAVERGARVINLSPVGYHYRLKHGRAEPWPRHKDSWGLPPAPALREACAAAYEAGAVLVCTLSNNENRRTAKYPTALEEVIGVTAVDRRGAKSTFSNYGPLAEIAGPGGRRRPGDAASWRDEEGIYSAIGREAYGHWSGGCQAVPFVAGVAALVLSRHPSWPAESVRQVVRNTATGAGWNEYLGHGIVNARRAVEVEEACADLTLDEADVVWTAEGHRYPAEGVTGTLRVTIHNRGVLDVSRAMVIAFDGEPDNRGFQLGHALFAVPGRECTSIELAVTLDPGHHLIHVVVDPFGHLPAARRARGEWYATARLRLTVD